MKKSFLYKGFEASGYYICRSCQLKRSTRTSSTPSIVHPGARHAHTFASVNGIARYSEDPKSQAHRENNELARNPELKAKKHRPRKSTESEDGDRAANSGQSLDKDRRLVIKRKSAGRIQSKRAIHTTTTLNGAKAVKRLADQKEKLSNSKTSKKRASTSTKKHESAKSTPVRKLKQRFRKVDTHQRDLRARARNRTKEVEEKVDYDRLARITGQDIQMNAISVPTPSIPRLAHALERVLFNPGVCHVRDPRTRVYNVDPHLEKLMPIRDFNFNTLNIFTPPSKDETLAGIARDSQKRYLASTSSLTSVLRHFHYLLSRWRPINMDMLSRSFPAILTSFTKLQRAPEAIFLRWKDGVYAIDADKMFDSANVLSLMGRYMEKLLVLNKEAFGRHRVGSDNPITDEERREPEAYHYSTLGDFVLRSQLDAHDPRLPGSGVFDLKTRAVVPIRMDSEEFESGMGYEIRSLNGEWQSFEREYHDMIRSTMLKYSLQVRMGRMDGIFVAYHNIARIFGFQYISLEDMDLALHGQRDRSLGDGEFHLSLRLLNDVFNQATEQFPEQTLRIHFEARDAKVPFMYIFVEPISDEDADQIQNMNKDKIEEWERNLLRSGPTGQTDSSVNVEQDVTSEFLAQSGRHSPLDAEASNAESQDNIADAGQPLSQALFSDSKNTTGEPKVEEGPVLAWQLYTYSHINKTYYARPPSTMTSDDAWDLSYELKRISESRAPTLYKACKERRRKELSEEEERRDHDYYRDMLRSISEEGKKWREGIDRIEEKERQEGKEKGMWDDLI